MYDASSNGVGPSQQFEIRLDVVAFNSHNQTKGLIGRFKCEFHWLVPKCEPYLCQTNDPSFPADG